MLARSIRRPRLLARRDTEMQTLDILPQVEIFQNCAPTLGLRAWAITAGISGWRNGVQPSFCKAAIFGSACRFSVNREISPHVWHARLSTDRAANSDIKKFCAGRKFQAMPAMSSTFTDGSWAKISLHTNRVPAAKNHYAPQTAVTVIGCK